ncbi:MAG: GYF domain-containing protein [Luteolibacter sp.]
MTEWHYTKMGLKQGPVPEDELRQKIRRAEIGDATLVWRDGMADWLPLSQVAELKADTPVAEPVVETEPKQVLPEKVEEVGITPSTLTMPVSKAAGNIQMEQPAAYHGNYVAPDIPSYLVPSIIGTVISAILVLMFCFSPGVITGIVAIVYGSKVDSLRLQGDLMAATSASKTAKVWMIVTYVLLGLPVLAGIGLVIFAVLSS